MKTEVAAGVWCVSCEFFEVEDFGPDRCLACGCPSEAHLPAVVVAETDDA